MRTEDGKFELNTPRGMQGDFELHLIRKRQTRFTSMDYKILSLYAKDITTRDIVSMFKEMYGAEVSATLRSRVTDAVIVHGDRMVIAPAECGLCDCLSGLHHAQDSLGQAND